MAKVCPLYSSSKGNATFVGNGDTGILIDAGVSCKRLVYGLNQAGLTPQSVKGIFITHDHSDHILGLKVFTSRYNIPIYAQSKTLEELFRKDAIGTSKVYEITNETIVCENTDIEITAFDTPHDTVQSCGYRVHTYDDINISVCTDLGFVTPTVERAVMGSDVVLLESNYDLDMLKNGVYPYSLKQRILSNNGHLCNTDSASFINRLIKNGTTRVILGHLSVENNTPTVAENTTLRALGEFKRNRDYILEVAPQESNGLVVTL